MYLSMKAEIAARDDDLRLRLLLGIAAWFLFVDHVPHNAVSSLTLRNFEFSGATDLFVFVGGYTAAILYGKMMLERGFVVAATRLFRRVWQLYAAYVALFVIYIDLIGYVARKSAAPAIISEFNVTGIVDHTIRTLIYGLLLQAKPLTSMSAVVHRFDGVFPDRSGRNAAASERDLGWIRRLYLPPASMTGT